MSEYYESDRGTAEYLLFHYGDEADILPPELRAHAPHGAVGFPARLVSELLVPNLPGRVSRALDLGCAVGRTSFELTRVAEEVVGIDFSRQFIATAQRLQREGALAYDRTDEGTRSTRLQAALPSGVEAARVHFEPGDACHLRADLGSFDLLVLANLICRLPEPRLCLERLPELARPGGFLLITSPYTWLEEHTPTLSWIGATPAGSSHAALSDLLQAAFEPVLRRDLPFLIREHARKYQWSVAEATLWRRR
ncbi:MAG: putative 4-mercaptohistidine N1-methyltransferase [Verrucomicrobiota bacterium]